MIPCEHVMGLDYFKTDFKYPFSADNVLQLIYNAAISTVYRRYVFQWVLSDETIWNEATFAATVMYCRVW